MATTAIVTTPFLPRQITTKHGIRACCQSRITTSEPPSSPAQRIKPSSGKGGGGLHLPTSLSSLLHLNLAAFAHKDPAVDRRQLIDRIRTPTSSPKEDISSMWREVHGSEGWEGLLDPLHPWLRREIVKYGEFAQATYDAFDADPLSEFCGTCLYGRDLFFDRLGLGASGYRVTRYLYAMSHVELPRWLERSLHAEAWCHHSNWMGYVAVSGDDESRRIGRRDIVVAWRGTVSPTEWVEDFLAGTERILVGGAGDDDGAKVEHGFWSMYNSKSEATVRNKTSAREQVMSEVKRLVALYRQRGEEVSLTVTGHSLGGALAQLTAHDAATNIRNVPTSVVSFGAPMVGNDAFRDRLRRLGVRVLRAASKQDAVPKLPGITPYVHAGAELGLDIGASPYLKRSRLDLAGFHGLETYLHLVDGFSSREAGFRREAKRDVALVNKCSGLLRDELRVPACWFAPAPNKGMVKDAQGRWVPQRRAPEDIPSPYREGRVTPIGTPSPSGVRGSSNFA